MSEVEQTKLSKLSEQHQRFVLAYVDNLNAAKSYQLVYQDAQYSTARTNSSKLLADTNIKEAVAEQFKLRTMTKEEVLSRIENIAKVDIQQYIKDGGDIDIAKIKEDN